MSPVHWSIPGIIPLALMVLLFRGLFRRTTARARAGSADEAVTNLVIDVVRRGLSTWIRVTNPSPTVTARNVRIDLDDVPATEHLERVRASCPPFCDLSPGQSWTGAFIFSRTRPKSLVVRWADSDDRQIEHPLHP